MLAADHAIADRDNRELDFGVRRSELLGQVMRVTIEGSLRRALQELTERHPDLDVYRTQQPYGLHVWAFKADDSDERQHALTADPAWELELHGLNDRP